MQLVKQCAGVLAAPLTMALLLAAGALLFRLRGGKRSAAWLLTVAGAMAYLGCTAYVGNSLLGPLERRYPPLRGDESLGAVGWIVVLGSDYSPHDGVPVGAALDADGLVRIVEGVRLAHLYPAMRLLASGGAPADQVPPAQGYAELARSLGVDPASIVVSDHSLDTSSEARSVVALLKEAPFILVTSAYHMPRAMRLMQVAGAHPIAAPTGQLVIQSAAVNWRAFLPTSGGLRKTERALHEYLGLLALKLGAN